MRKKFSSYLTLVSSAALAQGFLLLISPIITRLYGPEDVGGFGVILGLGALIGSVGTGRLEHAIPVARNFVDATQVALLGVVLVLSASALSVVVVSAALALGVVKASVWQDFPLLAIPVIAFSLAFFQLVNALLLRQRAFRSVGVNKICQGGVTGVAQLLLGWAALGTSGLIWAQALGYLAGGWSGVRKLLVRGVGCHTGTWCLPERHVYSLPQVPAGAGAGCLVQSGRATFPCGGVGLHLWFV